MELEKPIEKAILGWLHLQTDILAFKVNTGGIFDRKNNCFRRMNKYVLRGTADILACLNVQGIGIFVALEVKSKVGIQSENQKNFAYQVRDKNGFYFIVRSIEDAEKALKYVRTVIKGRIENTQSPYLKSGSINLLDKP